MKLRALVLSAAAAGALLVSIPANAAPISGLFNTGVDDFGAALVGGNGTADPHYGVLSSTIPGVSTGVDAVTYFQSFYAAEDADSRWISHSATGRPGGGTTTFRLTFDLTGFDPLTAALSGLWGVDNIATIFLNGVSTGISSAGFTSLASFSISSGFVDGLNTLDFAVTDFGAPLAFRVDNLAGTAELADDPTTPVPEPGTLALVGVGLLGLRFVRRRQAA